MRKYIKYNLFKTFALLVVASFASTSCEQTEPDYRTNTNVKPVVSFSQSSYMVDEGKDLEITLVTNTPLNEDMHFQLDIITEGSSATEFDDYELSLDHTTIEWATEDAYRIDFPKYQSSYTFTLSAFLDEFVEANETVMLKITPKGNLNGEVASNMAEVIINQRGSDIIEFTFDWDQTFQFSGSDYTLCDIGYDNDFVYADSNFNLIDYIAGTAACPEVGELSISELGDGDFHIFQNVWDDGNLSSVNISPAFSIPVTVSFSRFGSNLTGSYVQDAANAVDSDFGSDPNLNSPVYVVSFNISGTTVTMYDATTSTTIASGRSVKPQLKGLDKLKRRVK